MQLSNIPRRLVRAFASGTSGTYVRNVPFVAPAGTTGAASYEKGFPPETFQPVGSGGVPPAGQDVNGVLFDLSGWARWIAAGGSATFDGTFATAVGGYPKLSVLASTTPGRLYQSTVDNNLTDPDSGSSSGWTTIVTPAASGGDPNVTYFPDGTIDQRGEVAYPQSGMAEPVVPVSLIVPFSNATYNVQVTPFINNATPDADTWVQLIRYSRTTTGFSVQYQRDDPENARLDGFTWRAIGR